MTYAVCRVLTAINFQCNTALTQILFHGSNLATLHEKLSPSILPQEFGGDCGPMSNDAIVSVLQMNEQLFKGVLHDTDQLMNKVTDAVPRLS